MQRMVTLVFMMMVESVSASPFRVLIFPHRGKYVTPQGRESIVSRVKITSDSVCDQYPAQLSVDGEWQPVGSLVDSKMSYQLSSQAMKRQRVVLNRPESAFYFKCTKPFQVHRDTNQNAYRYEGDFVALFDGYGNGNAIQIVNLVDSEVYLKGVVPAEVGAGWPTEALKAQAVAARTYAWWNVLKNRKESLRNYDFDDTIQYQAYSGIVGRAESTDSAVDATAKLVLKYQGSVIKAYFSADSGGQSESARNGFGENLPYCVSKPELYDVSKVKSGWEKTFTLAQISSLLGRKLKSIRVEDQDYNESGRANQVTLLSPEGAQKTITGPQFRMALKLRSTRFKILEEVLNGQRVYRIIGTGFGHGVGMAQVGAKEYANQLGWTFDQIVKFYYDGTSIEEIPDDYTEYDTE